MRLGVLKPDGPSPFVHTIGVHYTCSHTCSTSHHHPPLPTSVSIGGAANLHVRYTPRETWHQLTSSPTFTVHNPRRATDQQRKADRNCVHASKTPLTINIRFQFRSAMNGSTVHLRVASGSSIHLHTRPAAPSAAGGQQAGLHSAQPYGNFTGLVDMPPLQASQL